MKMFRPTLPALAFLCALAFALPARADEADRLFAEGGAAFGAQKYEDARRSFEAAWKLRQSYDIAGGLAQAEMQLGKHREAAAHLAFALRTYPATGDDGLRKVLETAFADVKKHVASLRVTVNVDGADVRVDGVSVGRAPLADEVFVDPGPRTIEARLAQHVTASRKIEARKGAAEKVELVLAAESGTGSEPSRMPAYISFGAGGAGLLASVVVGAASVAKRDSLDALCSPAKVCPESARGAFDEANVLANVSNVGWVFAGLGAAAGTVLLFVPSRKQPVKTAVQVGPGFVGVKGTF